MAKPYAVERVSSCVPGFDKLIEGGLEKNSITLLKGGSGSGKTIFSLQFLYQGYAQAEESGAFISFNESKNSIFTTAKLFGWDLSQLERNGSLAFIRYSPHEVERLIKEGGGTLRDTIDSVSAKRVVVDSLTAYTLLFKTSYELNEGVLSFMELLKSWNCTVLVTEEEEVDPHRVKSGRLGFLSDGLVHFYHPLKDRGKFRAIEVIKMRHTNHSDRMHMFRISDDGITVSGEQPIKGKNSKKLMRL